MLPDEDASRARVVEMDVREEKMAEVGGLDTALLQPLLQAIEARGGTAIEQGRPAATSFVRNATVPRYQPPSVLWLSQNCWFEGM